MLIQKLQQEMKLSGLSPRTIKAYTNCSRIIYNYFHKPLSQVSESEFKIFLSKMADKNYSPYTLNLYHSTMKFVIKRVYNQKFNFKFPYAKRHIKLPVVLSKKEIKTIIENVKNPKHKVLISLSYGAGLRVSEVVSLKVKDLNLEELTIPFKTS